MNNFSERLNKLQESVGLEKTNFGKGKSEDFDDDYFGDGPYSKIGYDAYKKAIKEGKSKSEARKLGNKAIKDYIKNFSEDKKWKTYFKGSDRSIGPAYKSKEEAQKSIPEKESYYGCKGKLEVREVKNFSEDQGVDTQVTDEQSARALGESLAKKMWGDQYDQKIFDGVFATALEQCGENWDHVAAYLRKVYQGASQMNNFSERLNKLQESLGLEVTNFSEVPPTQTPAEPVVDNKETKPTEEVTKNQTGDANPPPPDANKNFSEDSVTDPEKKNPETPVTPAETTCPECGRKIVAEFTNLTDEEFAEIANEAKEIAKYPEQYETEGDRIQAFTSWLQNSRFKEFCNEALYKAFCGLK